MSAAFNAPFWLKKIIDHKKKLSCIKWLQMQSYSWPWKKTHHTASERHRTAIPTQFMLWKQCCQAALSLTLSCDNPSSVIHKLLLFGAGKDIKAILIQPVSLSSQDGRVGDCRSTTCRGEIGWKKGGPPASFFKQWYILIWRIHCTWDHMSWCYNDYILLWWMGTYCLFYIFAAWQL